MSTMSEPVPPSNPAFVLDPLNYLWGQAPRSLDAAFAHVLAITTGWLNDDDPPTDDEGARPTPPPPPPPQPAYPLLALLEWLGDFDDEGCASFWDVVQDRMGDWITAGPFA